jgi:hypothetical protein
MGVQEITLTLGNRPGVIQKIAKLLAEGRINVASISVSSQGPKSFIRMVVSDPERGLWLLRKAGYHADATELLVVSMEDKAGSLLRVLDMLAQHKININSMTILVTREGQRTLIGLGVDNPVRARNMLSDSGFLSVSAENLVTNAGLVASAVVDTTTESVGLLF